MVKQFAIAFHADGRGKAECPPDPHYPNGTRLDMSGGKVSCAVELPYPAPERGLFTVRCKFCNLSVAVTAAGRPDDPIELKLPCKLEAEGIAS